MADEEKYCRLGDVRINLDRVAVDDGEDNRGFSLSFWIYLLNSTRPASVILHQKSPNVGDELPFLALSEENKIMLFPLIPLHEEAPSPDSILPLKGRTHLSPNNDCPFDKWVHIGCQVTGRYMCLQINGIMVAGMNLVPLQNEPNILKKTSIVGNIAKIQGYIYNSQVLPLSSVKSQYTKDQPVKLTIEDSCIPDGVDLGSDGIWNIVGGKPSCRRNFSLEVCLLNACGQPVYKDMEIIASLVYADNNARVDKSREDSEDPLLLSCDGIEYPSTNRPVPLVRGRAIFKLKMAQLSSKSDNRLFRVYFQAIGTNYKYPFLEVYSVPIRCISRSKVAHRQTGNVRKVVPAPTHTPLSDEINLPKLVSNGLNNSNNNNYNGNGGLKKDFKFEVQSQNPNENQIQNQNGNRRESNSPLSKRMKVDNQKDTNAPLIQVRTTNREEEKDKPNSSSEETTSESILSDSDSTDTNTSTGTNTGTDTVPGFGMEILTDSMVFRYCLEGTSERATMLRDFAFTASDDDVADFAKRVCLYSGCSHHRNQILATKQLIQEMEETWATMSRNNNRVLWTYAVPEIVRKFMSIAKSSNRGLSGQDLEIMRGISGCTESMGREEFERLWNWMYPVALSLSKEAVNKLWECTMPRWIEGFVTREDSENALRGVRPGTFLLRFPTSRSWPHPDAGSIVISYLATNFVVRHKLLALDYCDERESDLKSLLMEEPELTQLGRVNRQEIQHT